tara:strand:+ start:7102 stop:7863 length:762 start_codon:yes stop_codon:yes gene_type:complete
MEELMLTPQEKAIIALNGQNGDTEAGIIDNKPVHLMKVEKNLIDRTGKKGESFIKAMSPATTNTNTGYDSHSMFSKFIGNSGNWFNFDPWGGKIESGWRSLWGLDETDRLNQQIYDVTTDGIRTIEKDLEDKVGPDGTISKSAGREIGNIQNTTAMQTESTMNQARNTMGNQGFSNSSVNMTDLVQDFVQDQERKTGQVMENKIGQTKDFVKRANEQKNKLLLDYFASTEMEYTNSNALTDLETLIDQYDGMV